MEYSIAKITITEFGECGTCYFLTKNIVATCFHVVENIFNLGDAVENKWDKCEIIFNPAAGIKVCSKVETLIKHDSESDIAILKLKDEIALAVPVMILEHNATPTDSIWKSQGYPAIALKERIQLSGQVVTLDGVLDDQPRIALTSPPAMKGELGGFSGSPVFVNNHVVGHLVSNTIDKNGVNIFGSLYAVSSYFIYKLAAECVEGFGRYLGVVEIGENDTYIKRGFESIISEKLLKTGQGVMLSGYLKSGKTHTIKFFENYKDIFAEFEKDLSKLIVASLSLELDVLLYVGKEKNLDAVSQRFCKIIKLKLAKYNFKEEVVWNQSLPTAFNVSNWFNKIFNFLETEKKRLMLFIDDAGKLFDEISPEENDEFFTILRGLLVEKRSYFGLLVSFTSTSVLRNPIPVPLLNMYYPISIDDFTEEDIAAFGNRYCHKYDILPKNCSLSETQLENIKEEIAGNPWLLVLFLEKLRSIRNMPKFVFENEFENKLSDSAVYFNYLDTLINIIPNELKEEISLFTGSAWQEAPEVTSKIERRRKLISIGILQKRTITNNLKEYKKEYKLRCRQFENITI